MLSKTLYDLSLLLSYPSNDVNSVIDSIDNRLIQEIYSKKSFNIKWRENLNYSIKNIHSNYIYNIVDQNFKFIKVKFNIIKSFILETSSNSIQSCYINKYIVIMEHLNGNFKIHELINEEENPDLYNYVLAYDLNQIESLLPLSLTNLWIDKLTDIDVLYENFISHTSHSRFNNVKERNSKFDLSAACDYAQKFALTPNPQYKVFEGIGGDCTNFISQIVHAGGVIPTDIWKPYTHSWIRVQEFYWYLTFQGIGFKLSDEYPLSKGDIIQFYTPKLGRFFHTGFITYELDNDYLYCCHSYNKLNYPLSAIYPIIYPQLRAVRIKAY